MECLDANDIKYELCSSSDDNTISTPTELPTEFENDCEEIKYLLKNKKFSSQILTNCTMNDDGNVTTL